MNHNSIPDHTIKKIQIIDANYLFVDGMSRSGKNSLLPIISSFNKVEHFKDRGSYDIYLDMYESGNLTKQGFNYCFATDLLQDVWFTMIGRDVNTNLHDLSSVMNSSKKREYLERVNRKDSPSTFAEILKEIKERQLIFPFVTNILKRNNVLGEISEKFKYIITMRNPIDMLFTWYRSGRATRLGTDSRYTVPSFQVKGFDNLPYSMLDNAAEYNKANPLEKCFLLIEQEITEYLNANLLHANNSCLVPIENYWIETEKYIKIFENFLGTSRTEFTNNEMINANIPRIKDNETFSIKANMIFDNINEKYMSRLKNLFQRYESEISDVYKLSSVVKSPKGKYKGLSVDAFSQISPPSKYNRGKRG